jgi:hypothetical protein
MHIYQYEHFVSQAEWHIAYPFKVLTLLLPTLTFPTCILFSSLVVYPWGCEHHHKTLDGISSGYVCPPSKHPEMVIYCNDMFCFKDIE